MTLDSGSAGGTTGTPATMRAYGIDGYGQPGRFRELPIPEPLENEVLVRMAAAAISTTDLAIMAGYMKDYFQPAFPLVVGIDGSGVVERIGPGVDGIRAGDEVFGYTRGRLFGQGTLAAFAVMDTGAIQRRPASLTHEQAAVIPHAALTAAAAVDAVALGPGDRVVILGATGGVGSFATQLAAATGASVIAVTRPEHAEYARSMGAADVIDYTATDPGDAVEARYPGGVEALIDLVPIPGLGAGLASRVHAGGRVASVTFPPDVDGLAARGVTAALTSRLAAEDRFAEITERIARGEIRPPTTRSFPFEEVDAALQLQAGAHVQGKLVIVV